MIHSTRGVAAWLLSVALGAGAGAAVKAAESEKPTSARKSPAVGRPPAMQAPLAVGEEFVEVTADGALRRRYHDLDYEKDLAFYMKEANAEAAKRPPNAMKLMMVFCREIHVTGKDLVDKKGQPVEYVARVPDEEIAAAPEAQRRFCDFLFAYTRGAIRATWKTKVIDRPLRAEANGAKWILQPKPLGDQLEREMADVADGEADLMAFVCHAPVSSDGKRLPMGASGVAWTAWWFKEAKTFTVTNLSLDMLVHEWLHHILDCTLQETEDLRLGIMHASVDLGYSRTDLGWPAWLDSYRDRLLYYYTRDMWRRWRMKGKHDTPREPFSGKAYAWADVKDDCWFKLPQLTVDDLKGLTGLQSLAVDAPRGKGATLFKVGPEETLSSPRIDAIAPGAAALDNGLSWPRESAAVLRSSTGHWLFVRPDLVDVYVGMRAIAGKPGKPLPVYGYLMEGVKPLIIVRALDDLPVPSQEIGYFRGAS